MEFDGSEETLNIWYLPNFGEDLDGPLQPKVLSLDIQLLISIVGTDLKEGGGCSDEVLYCLDSGISTRVNHPKRDEEIIQLT